MTSAAVDPMANEHAFYDAQHEEISELFQAADTEEDWDALAVKLIAALADPFIPRWYRAKFHAIYTWHCSDPEEQIRLVKESLDDMRSVLDVEGKTEDEIEERLEPIKRMIAAVEGQLIDTDESNEAEEVAPAPANIDAGGGAEDGTGAEKLKL